ncbi:hypothetical protein HYU22_01615 [Candidatus Woesearchaeota archaeon]|nr:hypothetical protein [Candidatus Woesearchaeota archaeon]
MADDDLKNLPPEARIKKLRELEKQRKREIEEAQEKIRESEDELVEQRKWKEKVPIPEVAKEELEGLGEEGKDLLKVHKGLKEKKESDEAPAAPVSKRSARSGSAQSQSLEETVEQEAVPLAADAKDIEYGMKTAAERGMDYGPLRQKPMAEIYQEAVSLKTTVQEKGYISKDDERRAEYLTGIVQERIEASETGKYSFTDEAARAASLTQMVGWSIQNAYKRGMPMEKNWYR